jgi:hypothetical protein
MTGLNRLLDTLSQLMDRTTPPVTASKRWRSIR